MWQLYWLSLIGLPNEMALCTIMKQRASDCSWRWRIETHQKLFNNMCDITLHYIHSVSKDIAGEMFTCSCKDLPRYQKHDKTIQTHVILTLSVFYNGLVLRRMTINEDRLLLCVTNYGGNAIELLEHLLVLRRHIVLFPSLPVNIFILIL